MRYWTKYQYPYDQAVLVEDGRVVHVIPHRPPKTPARRVACIGEHDGNLVVVRVGSWELWTPDGQTCLQSVPCAQLYATHAVEQMGDDLVFCSSGLDLFFRASIDGNINWKWWGRDYGFGGTNPAYAEPDWIIRQLSGQDYPVKDGAHYNSLWVDGDSILTSALSLGKIIRITPDAGTHEVITDIGAKGVHSPIYDAGRLIYGTRAGIECDGVQHLPDYQWIKFIRRTPRGFVFTHEGGVVFTDEQFNVTHEDVLPRPFQVRLLEGA